MTWVDDKVMSLGAKKEVAAQYNDRSEDFAEYNRLGENIGSKKMPLQRQ